MKWRVEESSGADDERQLKNSAPPAPHECADKCATNVPERLEWLELYGEARPKPRTLRRRAPKNTKNPSLCLGRAFWTESGSLISASKSIIPPQFWGYLNRKKCRFDIFFRTIFSFSKLTKCCVLTSFAGTMQKRRKCYQYFLNQRWTKHCKYQCFWTQSKRTL